jgi:hypothetical protein
MCFTGMITDIFGVFGVVNGVVLSYLPCWLVLNQRVIWPSTMLPL